MQELLEIFHPIDWVIIILAVFFAARGMSRGLSGELGGVIIAGFMLLGGWKLYKPLSEIAKERFFEGAEGIHVELLALGAALLGLFIIANLITMIFKGFIKDLAEGPFENIGGALAGFAKFAFLYGLVLLAVDVSPFLEAKKAMFETSRIGDQIGHKMLGWYEEFNERNDFINPGAYDDDDGASETEKSSI